MGEPVDLLLITHGRRAYVEKALPRVLEDPADFRIYWWDNASSDGTIDFVRSLRDERLVESRLSPENQRQAAPLHWFLDRCRSEVVGKIDDDVLLPIGWTRRFRRMILDDERFGMLACWNFMPEDWDEAAAAHNVVRLGGHRIFRMLTVGGCSFLARADLLRRFRVEGRKALPLDRVAMSLAGFVSGCPLPLAFAHHMDDPRSPECRMRTPGAVEGDASFTMRRLGFDSLERYAEWIAADARHYQVTPFSRQLRQARLRRDRSLVGRLKYRLLTGLGALSAPPEPPA